MAPPALDRDTILKAVQNWPSDDQVALAKEILRRASELRHKQSQAPAVPSASLRGLLANGEPAPSDEEVERWLDEHRMEKYGG